MVVGNSDVACRFYSNFNSVCNALPCMPQQALATDHCSLREGMQSHFEAGPHVAVVQNILM